MDFKITTNTKNVSFGDVFFCFKEAEKYLTIDVIDKVSQIHGEIGFKNRLDKNPALNSLDIKTKIKNKIYEHNNLHNELITKLKQKYKQPKQLIAITGTKGKTSTAWFIMQIYGHCGVKCGYIGTLGSYIFDGINIVKVNKDYTLTTPSIDDLYRYIDELHKLHANVVVFEASSHALYQQRLDGLNISCGIFTNFSQDHLDYHKTMHEYLKAKTLLFSKYLKHNSICVLNADDNEFDTLCKACAVRKHKVISVGKNKNCNVKIVKITATREQTEVFFMKNEQQFTFTTNILGEFQIYNLMEAIIACSENSNISYNKICQIIPQIQSPIGRMQNINNSNIFIDYAHTPKSLETCLVLLKNRYNNVVVVFGCGGNRDKQKRPIMFEIAIKIADVVIVTSDNPRFENAKDIINDILCFFKHDKNNNLTQDDFVVNEIRKIDTKYNNNNADLHIIQDRREAIHFAVTNFFHKKTHAILIAGKGHEDYQIIKNQKLHLSDQEEVEYSIKQLQL